MNSNLYHTATVRSLTSRFYETEHDLQQMQDLLMEARSRTDDWRYWHVGELMFGFFMVACHLNPQDHIRLWHDDEGKLVGYAVLGEDPSFDCQVLPEYEWSGIATEAMAWVEMRLTELCKRDAQQWIGIDDWTECNEAASKLSGFTGSVRTCDHRLLFFWGYIYLRRQV